MKRTLLFSVVIICLSLIFVTCEKEKKGGCVIIQTKIVVDNDSSYINFSYDSQNRLTKSDLGDGFYTTYSYATSKVTEKTYVNNALTGSRVYDLNAEGYATTCTYTLANASNATSVTTYEYDYDGYLEHEVTNMVADANDIEEVWYTYTDGNLTYKEREHTKTGYEYYSSTEYEYYTDKPNKFSTEVTFKGKQNTNLVKKTSVTINDSEPVNTVYTYETDVNGYVLKETFTIGTTMSVWIPVYKCD